MKPTTEKLKRRRKEVTPRDAEATRARIFEAAKILFSQNTYEGVGTRDIANSAGVDPALLIRYFGSKQQLFGEIVDQAFGVEEFFDSATIDFAENAADILMSEVDERRWRTGYDPLRLLLASIGSSIGGPILARALNRDFVTPISEAIGGAEANERAVVVSASIVGFALMRIVALDRRAIPPDMNLLRRIFAELVSNAVKAPNKRGKSTTVPRTR